jgi:UDP-N-acetylglucosamine--N-acetylmuramyl-(pentapeptide) pyrophosphoryl-undecaprenol N-acetylglucosamine transferase
MALVTHNAAIVIKDSESKEKLKDQAIALVKNEEACFKLSENISGLALPDSAIVIANEVISLINNKNSIK